MLKHDVKIFFFCSSEYKYLVENIKINIIEYKTDVYFNNFTIRNKSLHKFISIQNKGIIKKIQPDLIISDICCFFSQKVSKSLKVPCYVYSTSLLFNKYFFLRTLLIDSTKY